MNILIIGGGISDEREVSLRSAASVFEAAKTAGYQTKFYDWDGSEGWLLKHASKYDVVLPILHGAGGEDGEIQKLLESVNMSYLGSDSKVSELCFDKEKTREFLKDNGFRVPEGMLASANEYWTSDFSKKPHVLKPFNGGSSVDTFIFPNGPSGEYDNAINQAFARHIHMLAEDYVQGTEVTVPVLKGMELPIIEIIPPKNGVFDYDNKYNGQTQELVPPKNVSLKTQDRARQAGTQIHELMGCKHLSRVDMIITETDIYTLEVNTMPGLTDQSLFPKAANVAGLDFPEFVDYLIQLVVKGVA